ncbi:MAG TPA: ATP-binding protein [Acidimicrobiales bacterium]|nr:ATP-binding protein [Acidimicrobiales bacterium]
MGMERGGVVELAFGVPADLAALEAVRRRLVDVAHRLGASVDDEHLSLLATELMVNAMEHGLPPVAVRVRWDGHRLRVEVEDACCRAPELRCPAPHDVGGRGLWLIDQMASAWGVTLAPSCKVVWFELAGDDEADTAPDATDR